MKQLYLLCLDFYSLGRKTYKWCSSFLLTILKDVQAARLLLFHTKSSKWQTEVGELVKDFCQYEILQMKKMWLFAWLPNFTPRLATAANKGPQVLFFYLILYLDTKFLYKIQLNWTQNCSYISSYILGNLKYTEILGQGNPYQIVIFLMLYPARSLSGSISVV